jgi:hypothetical protein
MFQRNFSLKTIESTRQWLQSLDLTVPTCKIWIKRHWQRLRSNGELLSSMLRLEKAPATGQMGLTGGAQPIFPKQLRFDPTVWKTCLRLLMDVQSINMLKFLHLRMEFLHFLRL